MSEQGLKVRLAKLGRKTATALVTGGVVAIAGVAVWHGSGILADRAAAVERPVATAPLAVSVAQINLEDS